MYSKYTFSRTKVLSKLYVRLPILEKAHELQPDSHEIAIHLEEAYQAVGRDDAAKQIAGKCEL
jgi:hypothetical protein